MCSVLSILDLVHMDEDGNNTGMKHELHSFMLHIDSGFGFLVICLMERAGSGQA